MTDMSLYFGPYNDPGDHSGNRHWQQPRDPDFHNPAFTITRAGSVVSIAFAIRNHDTVLHTLTGVNLYAAACGLLTTASDVDALANMVVATTAIGSWPNSGGQSMDVPAISSAQDLLWSSTLVAAAIPWTIPAFANSFIVIATLQTTTQAPGIAYSSDPSAAIWLG